MSNPFDSANASRTLKIAGIVLILSFFVDFVLLLFPFRPTDQSWLIELATALVDRGIVPMVGLGMLLAGYGVDPDEGKSSPVDIRFPALILSTVLGIMFLLIFPLHVNNVLKVSEQRVAEIGRSADQAETGVKTQLQQLQAQLSTDAAKAELEKQRNLVKAQFSDLLKDETKYKQALENPQVPPAQKELLKKFKANPAELEKFIAQQSDPQQIASQRISQIIQQKEDAQNQARQQASKSGLRIGISSLLLAIGYSIIGWTGLRSFGSGVSSSARKAPAR